MFSTCQGECFREGNENSDNDYGERLQGIGELQGERSNNQRIGLVIENIKKYGNKNSNYIPFTNAVFYPLWSQDFIRTGFMEISPTLSARDYKDPKCVLIEI